MSTAQFIEEFKTLPEHIKQEVADFAAFLKQKSECSNHKEPKKKGLIPGLAKGMVKMSDDFDEPLEDFKDYM